MRISRLYVVDDILAQAPCPRLVSEFDNGQLDGCGVAVVVSMVVYRQRD